MVEPHLADCYGDSDDFHFLNHLAGKISRFDTSSLVKYKAMLEASQCTEIETALVVYEKMEQFTRDRTWSTSTDCARKVIKSLDLPMKEELHYYLSKDGYGNALMQHHGINNTSYGMLIPDDGIKLSEQLQKQSNNIEMTMSM